MEKTKEVAWATKEAVEASEQKFYALGVQDTEVLLAKELVEICRDYCKEVWTEALNLVGVPADLEWRKAKNIYPPDIREGLAALTSPKADVALVSNRP